MNESSYRVYPVHVGADLREDGGLLGVIAAEPGAKADDPVNLPGSITVLAVQWATRITLDDVTEYSFQPFCHITTTQLNVFYWVLR